MRLGGRKTAIEKEKKAMLSPQPDTRETTAGKQTSIFKLDN